MNFNVALTEKLWDKPTPELRSALRVYSDLRSSSHTLSILIIVKSLHPVKSPAKPQPAERPTIRLNAQTLEEQE